jgi:phosphatidylglycerol:prolipoprotein diacylglycerol transferase
MWPILLRIGEFTLRTYGLFVAIGVLLAYNYVRYQGYKRRNIDTLFLINLLFYTILVGFLGGRLLYVLLNFDYYKTEPLSIIKFWEGGLVFYGGFITGLLFGIIYTLIHKKNLFDITDICAPGLFLGLSIGRLGCFSAGCCYGKPAESFLGVIFSHPESLAPIGIKIYPTQLFESVYAFVVFLISHYLLVKDKFRYKIFFISGILYSVFRFINEFFRGDDRGTFLFGVLSPSQSISIIIFILFFGLIFCISKWTKRSSK